MSASKGKKPGYVFMFVKPKGLKSHPKQPKRKTLTNLQTWFAKCEAVDHYNAPIIEQYRKMDERMKQAKGIKA